MAAMKKIFLISLCVSIFAACSKEAPIPQDKESDLTFEAALPQTKVSLHGNSFLWNTKDAIKVFSGGSYGKFVTNNSDFETLASFTGSLSVPDPEDGFWAVYPYNEETTFSDGQFSIDIPAYYNYNGNLDGIYPFVAYAPGDSRRFDFKNVLGGVAFTLSRSDIVKVVISAPGGESLAGEVKVAIDGGGIPVIESIVNGSSEIEITSNEGILRAGRWYYVPIIPQHLSKGLLLKMSTCEYAEAAQPVVSATEINRSTFGMLDKIDSKATFSGAVSNSYIVAPGSERTFEAQYGISADKLTGSFAMSVLWESVGTEDAPEKGSVISSVVADGGKVTVKAGQKEGNAVIAARSAAGTTLWSWHIWVTAREIKAMKGIMDCNLGALSATPGDPLSYGLYYQYGRKDPFPGVAATPELPSPLDPGSENYNLAYANSYPSTFILSGDNGVDRLYAPDYEDQWWWGYGKSRVDPCPEGWRAPQYSFNYEQIATGKWDSVNVGFNSDFSGWLPAAGRIDKTGSLTDVGRIVYLWSGSDSPRAVIINNKEATSSWSEGMCGIPVRCVRM